MMPFRDNKNSCQRNMCQDIDSKSTVFSSVQKNSEGFHSQTQAAADLLHLPLPLLDQPLKPQSPIKCSIVFQISLGAVQLTLASLTPLDAEQGLMEQQQCFLPGAFSDHRAQAVRTLTLLRM